MSTDIEDQDAEDTGDASGTGTEDIDLELISIQKVISNHRVTIPEDLRKELEIGEGVPITLSVEGDRVIVRKASVVGKEHRVTLSGDIREKVDISEGDDVKLYKGPGRIVIEKK